jgi:hypothetical protein
MNTASRHRLLAVFMFFLWKQPKAASLPGCRKKGKVLGLYGTL